MGGALEEIVGTGITSLAGMREREGENLRRAVDGYLSSLNPSSVPLKNTGPEKRRSSSKNSGNGSPFCLKE